MWLLLYIFLVSGAAWPVVRRVGIAMGVAAIVYSTLGFWLMYPGLGDVEPGGSIGFTYYDLPPSFAAMDRAYQAALCAEALIIATACSRLSSRVALPTALLTLAAYSLFGSWMWGGGWLDALGFRDHSGVAQVFVLGGAAGLAAAWCFGVAPSSSPPRASLASRLVAALLLAAMVIPYLVEFNLAWYSGIESEKALLVPENRVSATHFDLALGLVPGVGAALLSFLVQKIRRRRGFTALWVGALSGLAVGASIDPRAGLLLVGGLTLLSTIVAVVVVSIPRIVVGGVPRIVSDFAVPAVCLASGFIGTLAAAEPTSSIGVQFIGALTAAAIGVFPFALIALGGRVASTANAV